MKKFESNWAKIVLSGASLILIYKLFNNFKDITLIFDNILDVLFPIILGLILAFFVSKPAERIERLILKTKVRFLEKKALLIGVILIYAVIFLVITVAIKFITPKIYKNVEDLAKNIPSYYNVIKDFVEKNEFLSQLDAFDTIGKKLASMFDITQINKYIGIISGIANSFITFFLAIILSIYMVIEKKNIFRFLKQAGQRFIPENKRETMYFYGEKTVERFYSYFTGLALDAVLVGTVSAIFFTMFKVPYALLLGLIVGFGNLIPFFGPIVSNIVIFIITAITTGPFKAIWVIVFQFIFGQIDGNIIQPKILSNSTGISPLLVLIAVIIFGDLFGFIGMIVGVPLFAVIKDVVVDYVDDGKINNKG